MGAFLYRLEQEDGTPADPPTLRTAIPNWNEGDTIPLPRGRALRVLNRLDANLDGDPVPVLVVEPA